MDKDEELDRKWMLALLVGLMIASAFGIAWWIFKIALKV